MRSLTISSSLHRTSVCHKRSLFFLFTSEVLNTYPSVVEEFAVFFLFSFSFNVCLHMGWYLLMVTCRGASWERSDKMPDAKIMEASTFFDTVKMCHFICLCASFVMHSHEKRGRGDTVKGNGE